MQRVSPLQDLRSWKWFVVVNQLRQGLQHWRSPCLSFASALSCWGWSMLAIFMSQRREARVGFSAHGSGESARTRRAPRIQEMSVITDIADLGNKERSRSSFWTDELHRVGIHEIFRCSPFDWNPQLVYYTFPRCQDGAPYIYCSINIVTLISASDVRLRSDKDPSAQNVNCLERIVRDQMVVKITTAEFETAVGRSQVTPSLQIQDSRMGDLLLRVYKWQVVHWVSIQILRYSVTYQAEVPLW